VVDPVHFARHVGADAGTRAIEEAQLSLAVRAPTIDVAVGFAGAGVVVTAAHFDDVAEPVEWAPVRQRRAAIGREAHRRRVGAVARSALAELAASARAPAPDGPVGLDGARVIAAPGELADG